jgi:hypothetical protein
MTSQAAPNPILKLHRASRCPFVSASRRSLVMLVLRGDADAGLVKSTAQQDVQAVHLVRHS